MQENNGSTAVIRTVLEASLARVLVHYEDKQFGILTSWQGGGKTKEDYVQIGQNNENFAALKKDVHEARFDYIPLMGIAKEELRPEEQGNSFDHEVDADGKRVRHIQEPSLFVINQSTESWQGPRPEEAFRWLMIHLGRKYNQSCVIVGRPGAGMDLIKVKTPIQVERHCHKIRPSMLAQFYSQLKPDRKIVFEALLTPAQPKSCMEGMARESIGETFEACRPVEGQIIELLQYLWKGKR